MSEDNRSIARRFYRELVNQGDLALADELVAEDFVDHNPPSPDIAPGREGLKQVFAGYHAAFPDMKLTVEDLIAEGDKIVMRGTASGTHQGDLMGIPATGKSISIGVIDILRFEGGRIVERWGQDDTMGMMQQLGLVPPPGG